MNKIDSLGYVADNPNIEFLRCDGRVFSYDEVNTASVSNTRNSQTITGGWSNFPLAYIDTDSTMEVTFASSQFGLDMFEMASATNAVVGDVGVRASARYEVEDDLKLTIPMEVQEGSVYINGLTEGDAAAAGTYKVEITEATAEAAGSTVITFAQGDVSVGDTLRVAYKRRAVESSVVSDHTTSKTVKGELTLTWPVYSAGIDCTESTIKGYLHRVFYRVRATAMPGFDSSYKTAATNSITFAAIDPKRADKKMADWIYEPLDENGEIVTKSDSEVNWN